MNDSNDARPAQRANAPPAATRHPNAASSPTISAHALPEGTRLLDFRITGVLGEGGFGIVYLAIDETLQRRVAVKEYLPASIASRAAGSTTVIVRSENQRETFERGLKSFVNEARLLARFDHPSLVKVYRFWEANDTAYMAMPYYEGPTLKRVLADLGRPADEAEVRRWLWPLLAALEVMHGENCFHRDIAPDNILLTAAGPVLLDFGAARHVVGELTHELTAILKPGFAPIEQYGDIPGMGQGPWTDIYALAGVVYAAITGQRPVPSIERLLSDQLPSLRESVTGRCSARFLAALDAALAPRPEDRPQSIAAFMALLDGQAEPSVAPNPSPPTQATVPQPLPSRVPAVAPKMPGPKLVPAPSRPETAAAPIGSPIGSRRTYGTFVWIAGAGLVGAALLAYLFVPFQSEAPPVPAATPASALPAVPAASPAASAATTATAQAAEAATPQMPAHAASAAPTATTAAPESTPAVPTPVVPTASAAVALRAQGPASAASAPTSAVAASAVGSAPPRRPRVAPDPEPARPATRPATGSDGPSPQRAPPAAEATRAAPSTDARTDSRCGDILQKGSLEPLTPGETEYLKRNCR